MRREWLLVAAVLVPFAALVVSWWWRGPEPSVVASPGVAPAEVSRQAGDASKPLARAGDAAVLMPEPEVPEAIAAPIKAVGREVHACFVDNEAHLHGRVEVVIAFEPMASGTFRGVSVETPLPSPELTACLEDVFAELHFEPTGRETFAPARHTFIFDAPPR